MSSPASAPTERLAFLPLRDEDDIVLARNCARTAASLLGLDRFDRIRIAIAASDIARLIVKAHIPTRLELAVELAPPPAAQALQLRIARAPAELSGETFGRLVDRVFRVPGVDGEELILTKGLHGRRFTVSQLREMSRTLEAERPVGMAEELAASNRDLLEALEDSTARRIELQRINEELTETNRGVVALYDELDTLHRVGRVVASQIDLDSLLRAITEATTDITGADMGAFLVKEPNQDHFTCHSARGPLCTIMENEASLDTNALFQGGAPGEVLRIDDLNAHPSAGWSPHPLRSYLIVAVNGADDELAGALVFGHRQPAMFSERTERILSSVAIQVSIGIQNARLYRNVQAASAAKDQFLAMLSHELRTPLNPVLMLVAALEANPELSAEVKRDLQVMKRNLQLEARLIDDMLDLTRIVRGKVALHFETVDVHSLIPVVRDVCQEQIQSQEVEVRLNLNAAQSCVVADSARLQQVLWNLLSNALKFSPRGRVEISTSNPKPDAIRIEVKDNGRGISEETMGAIFQPFDQGDAGTNATYGGLGLGLAISKKVIDAHGGTIRVESAGTGKGAQFFVELRAVDTPAGYGVSPENSPGTSQEHRGEHRILLVEDHEDTLHTLCRLLNLRGFEVVAVSTAAEASRVAAETHFDLVISDVGLPDRSGHELMHDLRERYRLCGIALSGYGMEADVERSHVSGFVAHLTKPIDFAALEKAIAWALAPDRP